MIQNYLKEKYRTLASPSRSGRRGCDSGEEQQHKPRKGMGGRNDAQKILEPVGGPDRCLLIGSFRGTKQESTWSHRKPYKPKSNRATSSITDGLLRAAHFLAPREKFSRR